MARIGGVDLPRNKRIEIALTYIYGIGVTKSRRILSALGVSYGTRTDALTDDEVARIREYIERNEKVEGDVLSLIHI